MILRRTGKDLAAGGKKSHWKVCGRLQTLCKDTKNMAKMQEFPPFFSDYC
jgi:hypothetical protein